MAVVSLTAALSGCSDSNSKIDQFVQKLLEPRRSPQQYMLVAVSDGDADLRRDAVARVARSKKHDEDWAIKGYVAIALLESDNQARGVAIRALAQTSDRRASETTLKIINYRDYPPEEVRPPDALCRWDAVSALADLSVAGHVPPDLRDAAGATLLERLAKDESRHTRAAAARGLGVYESPEVVRGLIAGLRDDEFVVVHQCEESLVRLTGQTHNCDRLAWEGWVEANQAQLFASAGQIPESRRPPYSTKVGKFMHQTGQVMRWLVPPRKE